VARRAPTSEHRYPRFATETLSWLYELIVVTRELDGDSSTCKRQGSCAVRVVPRQEAAQIGAALPAQDRLVVPQYREIGASCCAASACQWRRLAGKWHGGIGFTDGAAPRCCSDRTPRTAPVGAAMVAGLGEIRDTGVPWRRRDSEAMRTRR